MHLGCRAPNTASHWSCKKYLKETLEHYNPAVIIQKFKRQSFNANILQLYNLIASFNPKAKRHLLLAAHWDARPFADKDTINLTKPIMGANDGISGVGVLLEIARIINQTLSPIVGIDIALFDGENYGIPKEYEATVFQKKFLDTWGSEF